MGPEQFQKLYAMFGGNNQMDFGKDGAKIGPLDKKKKKPEELGPDPGRDPLTGAPRLTDTNLGGPVEAPAQFGGLGVAPAAPAPTPFNLGANQSFGQSAVLDEDKAKKKAAMMGAIGSLYQ